MNILKRKVETILLNFWHFYISHVYDMVFERCSSFYLLFIIHAYIYVHFLKHFLILTVMYLLQHCLDNVTILQKHFYYAHFQHIWSYICILLFWYFHFLMHFQTSLDFSFLCKLDNYGIEMMVRKWTKEWKYHKVRNYQMYWKLPISALKFPSIQRSVDFFFCKQKTITIFFSPGANLK